MSKIEVDAIEPQSGTALTIGASGDTITIPSGATLTNAGTATGFAAIAWQSVVTAATLTAVAGRGYPINTSSNACTVTLPAAASVGDQIIFTDYARNWGTNALTINPNSLKYQGNTSPNPVYDTNGESIHIVYVDATKGWVPLYDGAVAMETPQTLAVTYLVVAGGASGGGGTYHAGGGGAGGYRTDTLTMNKETAFTVTVGAGGATATGNAVGVNGANSVFYNITSAGGGGGGSYSSETALAGGSGGGGAGETPTTAGAGNTPPTSPVQGYAGGAGNGGANGAGGGGGGASQVGSVGGATPNAPGGDGGDGAANTITGGSVTYAGGGGGAGVGSGTAGAGGAGGGGAGGSGANGVAGTANTGGGGGGAERGGTATSGAGGSGIVILKIVDTNSATFSGGVTSSLSTSVSGYKIYSITATTDTSQTVTFS
jgi:hypothetical protein